jgi:hypothetical protein
LAVQIHGIRSQTIRYCRSRFPYPSFQSLILFRKTAPRLITGSHHLTTRPMFRLREPSEGITCYV